MSFLSPLSSTALNAGQMVVHQGGDVWLPYNQAINTGGLVGLALTPAAIPGNPFQVLIVGDVPINIITLGSGQATTVVGGLVPTRGSVGTQVGYCDTSGRITLIPSQFNVSLTTQTTSPPFSLTLGLPGQGPVVNNSGTQYVPQGLRTVFNVKQFGAKGDGVTDDTAAIQSAAAAFQTACLNTPSLQGGTAPVLYFPAATYNISNEIVFTKIQGGIIEGDGMLQTRLAEPAGVQALAGKRGFLVFVDCAYMTIRDLQIYPNTHHGILNATANSGQTAVSVGSFGYGSPVNGQRAFMLNAAQSKAELVSIQSSTATTATLQANLLNTYNSGDALVFGPLGGICFFSDQTIASPTISTNNRCEKVMVGNAGNHQALSGFALVCKGGGPMVVTATAASGQKNVTVNDASAAFSGEVVTIADNIVFANSETATISSISGNVITMQNNLANTHTVNANNTIFVQSASDVNNEEHYFEKCFVQNAVVGFYLEGLNCLANVIDGCIINTSWDTAHAIRGGSCIIHQSVSSLAGTGWDLEVGGPQSHPWLIHSTTSADSHQGLIHADPSWGLQAFDLRAINFDKNAGPSAGSRTIDITGFWIQIALITSNIDCTGDFFFKDLLAGSLFNGVEPGFVTLNTCRLLTQSMTFDGLSARAAGGFFGSATLTKTLLHNATYTAFGETTPTNSYLQGVISTTNGTTFGNSSGTGYSIIDVNGLQIGAATEAFGNGSGGLLGLTNATVTPNAQPGGGLALYSVSQRLGLAASGISIPAFIGAFQVSHAAATSGAGANDNWNGQSAAVGSGLGGGNIVFTPGTGDGSGAAGTFEVVGPLSVGEITITPVNGAQTLSQAQSGAGFLNLSAGASAGFTINFLRAQIVGSCVFIRNNTTQLATINFLTGSGNSVASGECALLASDGTNLVKFTGTYTPGVAANWNPSPTTIFGALDQLAATNTATGANGGGLGPATSVSQSTGNITKAHSGLCVVFAQIGGTDSSNETLTATLLRDGPSGTVIKSQPVPTNLDSSPTADSWQVTLIAFDTLPDTSTHTYTIKVTGAGNLSVSAGNAQVGAFELV